MKKLCYVSNERSRGISQEMSSTVAIEQKTDFEQFLVFSIS